jgi:hypothetical protein
VERRRYVGRVNTEETVLTLEPSGSTARATVLYGKGGIGLRAVVGFTDQTRMIIQSESQEMLAKLPRLLPDIENWALLEGNFRLTRVVPLVGGFLSPGKFKLERARSSK